MIEYKDIIGSTVKAIKKANINGLLDLKKVNLYNLLTYYLNYTEINNLFVENKCIKQFLIDYKYKNKYDICNYTLINSTNLNNINIAPVITDININLNDNSNYIFKISDFLNVYNDSNFDNASRVRIKNLNPTNTNIYFNNILIPNIFEIDINEVINIEIKRINNNIFNLESSLEFQITDGILYSNISNINIEATTVLKGFNNPATIGDQLIYSPNRAITVLTLDMFTNTLSPPYNDPENDLIDAIRIDEISTSNKGKFLFNNIEIVVGQIITREDLNNNLFVHQGVNQDDISSDVFNFSARDEGSKIWVN